MSVKAETAIEMIHELVAAEVNVVITNNRVGGTPKSIRGLERVAVERIFKALVEREPTQDEITKITEL